MAIDSKQLLVAIKSYARGNAIPLDSSEHLSMKNIRAMFFSRVKQATRLKKLEPFSSLI